MTHDNLNFGNSKDPKDTTPTFANRSECYEILRADHVVFVLEYSTINFLIPRTTLLRASNRKIHKIVLDIDPLKVNSTPAKVQCLVNPFKTQCLIGNSLGNLKTCFSRILLRTLSVDL